MFSRYAGYRRRGSVLILVVGVLAMLFVIGTTQLMVARFEKQNAETKSSARDLKGVVSMLYLPMAEMFQNDALAATNADLDPALQDWADFGGTANEDTMRTYVSWLGLNPDDNAVGTELLARLLVRRSGDGLIASLEPHWDPAAGQFRYFSISLGLDSFPNLAAVKDSLNSVPPGSFRPVITFGDASKTVSNPITGATQLHGNAEGSGVTDSLRMDVALSSLYEGKYKMFQRVISHGGMVMLDRTTHPALLAQVIHPSDTQAHSNPPGYLFEQGWSRTSTDEERLRRRGYLPESTKDYGNLLSNDLRRLIPFTLGYDSARYRNVSPHWWPVGSDHTVTVDENWWRDRMRPMVALTEGSYNASQDQYDRRHLLTTHSYDDLLRPQRGEARLLQLPDGVGGFYANQVLGQYFHVINPTATSDTSYNRFETQGRLAYQFAAGNPTAYSPEPLAYGVIRTGFNPFSLQFNRPGLRTPFSLRDTLVVPNPASYPTVDEAGTVLTWTYQASLKRFVQLTGYYLAMIQNTTVPGAAQTLNLAAGTDNPTLDALYTQLHTAAQLAVNTIDFADNADVTGDGLVNAADVIPNASNPIDPLTAFTYTNTLTGNDVTVYGFEKQPFITEAYVKNIHKPVKVGESYEWLDEPDTDESIYAVELYNPYSEALVLDDFALEVSPNVYVDMTGLSIARYSYIVLANTSADVALGRDPFVGEVGTTLFTTEDGHLTMLTSPETEGDEVTPGTPATASPGGSFQFALPGLAGGDPAPINISLVRKSVLHLGFSTAGVPVARLETATVNNGLGARAVVDTLTPTITGTDSHQGLLSDNWASDVRFGAVGDTGDNSVRTPEDDTDLLIAESSLQRRKDLELFGGVYRPIHWHFTIAQQMVFPLPWDEHVDNPDHVVDGLLHPLTRPGALPQHNLLGTAEFINSAGISNQDVMVRYMEGLALNIPVTGTLSEYPDGRLPYVNANVLPVLDSAVVPVAPVQLVTSDLGLDAYGRCRAYPTTGTLLLVSRYAHVKDGTVLETPVTTAVTADPSITDQRGLAYETDLTGFDPLRQVDNGHLPVFDPEQVVLGEPRRLQMPWGQLVFDYFTTLPIEELFQLKDLSPIGGPASVRLVDLYDESNPTPFENAYKFVVNGLLPTDSDPKKVYGSSPVQEVVSASGTRTIGPKVRGRINVNMAPWWVLDGLPVLPDAYWEPGHANYGLYNGLPVPELVSDVLDPATFDDASNTRAAWRWLNGAVMEPAHVHTASFATLHPAFARYLVSYREKRIVDGQGPDLYNVYDESYFAGGPGYVGVGALCDVPRRIPLAEFLGSSVMYQNSAMPAGVAFNDLRLQVHAGTGRRPFAYLGYLQLVAPVVRLQDWATVKSHVYTMYNLVGDNSTPPIWLRSQTTIDRTRCLYTNDLPEKIVHTEPISYFNAVSDQK